MRFFLLRNPIRPSLFGGILPSIGGNLRVGHSEIFVSEACEYTNSFLNFRPKYSIILNVEAEHLDFFKDINDIRRSFRKFAGNTLADGATIINGEIADHQELTDGLPQQIITYGFDDSCEYYADNLTYDDKACPSFTAMHNKEAICEIKLAVPGRHNAGNAMAAIALACTMGISTDVIIRGLDAFHGANRRFQYKGTVDGVTIIDDYAHHPTEIRATLTAAQKYPHKRLVLVFQPHTYSRTKAFLDDFCRSTFHGRCHCSGRHLCCPRTEYLRCKLERYSKAPDSQRKRRALFSFF